MAGRSNHPESLDPRWELVETRNATGRALLARRPLVGAVFGPLTVLRSDAANSGFADCVCVCGTPRRINVRQLWREQSLRCRECANAELRARLWRDKDLIPDDKLRLAWADRYKHMVRRCTVPTDPAYPNYGGRGITVYAPWVADRRMFYEYARTLPRWDEGGLDLDRKDNERGYEPGNLRLVPRRTNANNKRSNRHLIYRNTQWTVTEFWRRYCPTWRSTNSVSQYLDQGKTPEWIVGRHNGEH